MDATPVATRYSPLSRSHASACNAVHERAATYGVNALSDAELVAQFFVGHANPLAVANDLIERFGSLARIVSRDTPTLSSVPGVTARRITILRAAFELSRRIAFADLVERERFSSPADVQRFLALHFASAEHESFGVIYLDNRHRVVTFEELFRGTVDSAVVFPREVIKRCLAHNASSVIVAHVHPTGFSEPSDMDVRLTRRLADALAMVDIKLIDHIVVGQNQQTSLAERGLL